MRFELIEDQDATIQDPVDTNRFELIDDTDEEYSYLSGRNLGRTAKSIGSTILGMPGDFNNFVSSLVSKGVEKVTGYKSPEKPKQMSLIQFPSSSEIKETVEKYYPDLRPQSDDEAKYEETVELFTNLATPSPGGKMSAGQKLLRSALGTAAGMGAKEIARSVGADESTQEYAKILSSVVPMILQGKISPSDPKVKSLYEGGKKLGYTDKELAPLLQSDAKRRFFQKLSKPIKSVKEQLSDLKNRNELVFSDLKTRAKDIKSFTPKQTKSLQTAFYDILEDLEASALPTKDKLDAIKRVEMAIGELEQGKFSPYRAVETYRDVNKAFKNSGVGSKPLQAVKDEIITSMRNASPELADDFVLQNKLYQKFKNFEDAFAPTIEKQIKEGIISGSEAVSLLTGIATGNIELIAGAVGTDAARTIATKLLTDPSWQNIHKNTVKALANNSPKAMALVENQIFSKLDVDDY